MPNKYLLVNQTNWETTRTCHIINSSNNLEQLKQSARYMYSSKPKGYHYCVTDDNFNIVYSTKERN